MYNACMERNFTPLDVPKLEKKYAPAVAEKPERSGFDSAFNTVLILLATITVLAVSIVLFVLIQKEMRPQSFVPGRVAVTENKA